MADIGCAIITEQRGAFQHQSAQIAWVKLGKIDVLRPQEVRERVRIIAVFLLDYPQDERYQSPSRHGFGGV